MATNKQFMKCLDDKDILIMDEDKDIIQSLREVLLPQGHLVFTGIYCSIRARMCASRF